MAAGEQHSARRTRIALVYSLSLPPSLTQSCLASCHHHFARHREACAIKLDSARNEIILVNLKMTLASLCLMVCVVSGCAILRCVFVS